MIVFIHVPDFYAAVEQADDPGFRGRPLIVGGDPKKRGSVTSASAEARRAGAVAGMLLSEALERCPDAVVCSTRLKRYREVSAEIRAILRAACERIEELGPDGTFLEPPGSIDPVASAAELCVRLRSELGISAVAGIAPSKFVAYLAALHAGPSGMRAVAKEGVREFLAPFAVTELWGLGPATAQKLAEHGITRIADLQQREVAELLPLAGRNAERFARLARGEDDDPLRPKPRAKSLSQERTLPSPSVDLRTLGEEISELADQLEGVLARERRAATTVTVGISYVDGTHVTRTQSVDVPLTRGAEIAEVATQLLQRAQAGARPARRLKLQLTNLCGTSDASDSRQLRLF